MRAENQFIATEPVALNSHLSGTQSAPHSVHQLSPAQRLRDFIRKEGVPVRFSRSELVFEQGKSSGQVFLIDDGIIAVTHSCTNLHRQIYEFLFSSALLLPDMGGQSPLFYSAECLSEVSLHSISRQSLERILEADPELHYGLYQEQNSTIKRMQSHLSNIMCRQGEARVAYMLCELHNSMVESGQTNQGGDWIGITQIDLASSVGMTPVYINQILKKMKDSGLIALNKGKIRILRPNKIEACTVA